VQFGLPLLELNSSARLDFEQRSSLLGFGNSEAVRALLNLKSDFSWNFFQRILNAMPCVKVRPRYKQADENQGSDEPAAQACCRNGHEGSVVEVVSGQWSVVGGRWSVVSGQWSVVSGRWSVVGGQWSVSVVS